MYDLMHFCRDNNIPQEVTRMILDASVDNTHGLADLRRELLAACKLWDTYQKLDIPEAIYLDTMALFAEFIQEYKACFGCYGYEWFPWHHFLTQGKLFRIGALVYRLEDGDEGKQISLHVPAGIDFSLPSLRASWEQAKCVLERAFPDYRGVPWICHSWLLSPQLPQLLPPESRILAFQHSFVTEEMEDDGDYGEWIYPNAEGDDMNLPDETTLQLNLKYYILAEFPFHSGKGILIPEPFLE